MNKDSIKIFLTEEDIIYIKYYLNTEELENIHLHNILRKIVAQGDKYYK